MPRKKEVPPVEEAVEPAAAVIELRPVNFMIPLTQREGLPISVDELHQQITFALSARFGGCYGTPVNAAWRHTPEEGIGMIIVEPMLLVTTAIGPDDEADFRDYALAAARAFKQETLYWTDRAGVAHLVPVINGRVH